MAFKTILSKKTKRFKNNFIDNGMVLTSKENDIKLVNEVSIQVINVSKTNEAITSDNSYLFGSHNLSKIGKISLITAQENNKKKNIEKILKGEKGLIHVKFREPVFLTSYNNSKKFGSIAFKVPNRKLFNEEL